MTTTDYDYVAHQAAIGARMLRKRLDWHYTQAEVAARISFRAAWAMSHDTYGRIERGRRFPNLAELHEIARVLKVDTRWLIYGTPEATSAPEGGDWDGPYADVRWPQLRPGMIVQWTDSSGAVARATIADVAPRSEEWGGGVTVAFKGAVSNRRVTMDDQTDEHRPMGLVWAPTVAEPTGYDAVVELAGGLKSHRIGTGEYPWFTPHPSTHQAQAPTQHAWSPWSAIAENVVRVLSEGEGQP